MKNKLVARHLAKSLGHREFFHSVFKSVMDAHFTFNKTEHQTLQCFGS